MDTLNPKELDYQYAKIAKYLKQNDEKMKKYKKYKSLLYKKICERIESDPSSEYKFTSVQIIRKQPEKAPLNEAIIEDFFAHMYSSTDIQKEMMKRFRDFRSNKGQTLEPTIILKLNS